MPDSRPIPADSTQPAESLCGTLVGRFRIGERLGKGGMGEVYRAEDSKLKRLVALKRLAPALRADANYRNRFLREAERASRFSDAHVAAVYDILEEQGEIFLVLEYVEGETLRERMQRPLPLEEFLAVAVQCAEALVAAHEHDIVHCDIKPENIMHTPSGQVKILDFGVAKRLPRSDQSSTADREGMMAGTPAYMSPEVLLEKEIDGRADVFSLGVVFYEALTGHHPFLASSFVATTDRIRKETPASIHSFKQDVPGELEAVVAKAMAKKPGQRYGSARELLEDLRRLQAGLAPGLSPAMADGRGRKQKWILAVAGIMVILVAGAFALRHWFPRPPVLAERGWVLISDFDTSGDDALPDKGVREALTISLQQSQYVNVFPRSRAYEVLQRMKKENVARIDETLGREICQRENLQVLLAGSIQHIGPVFQITVQAVEPLNGNLLFAEKERFDRKEEFFERTDDIVKRARQDLGESMARIEATSRPLAKVTTPSLEALQLYSQAKDATDQSKQQLVLPLLQAALQLDPDFALAHLRLGEYYASIVNKNEKAVAEFKRAYDLRQGVTDREQLWIEASYALLQEHYEDAVQSLSVLVGLYPDDLDYRLALADAYDAVAQPDKTIAELRQLVKLNRQSVTASARLIVYLARSNADQEAIQVYEAARQRGLDSPGIHNGLGLAYLGLGEVPQARAEFARVTQGGQPFQDLGEFYLAQTDVYEGKLESARGHLEAIAQRDGAAHSKGLQPVSYNLLGRIYLLTGRPDLARRQAERILALPESDLLVFEVLSAGVLYARSGAEEPAGRVLRRLEKASHDAPTAWNRRSVLTLEGEIAMAKKAPEQAAKLFLSADEAYPQASSHVALALAYEAQDKLQEAAAQWQRVLKARGEILQEEFPADLAMAHLQLARISGRLADVPAARQHYTEFLQLWQQADKLAQEREAASELQAIVERLGKQDTDKQTVVHEAVN